MHWEHTHRVIAQSSHVSLHCCFEISGLNESCRKVDVAIDKVGLQCNSITVVFKCFGEKSALFEDVSKIRVSFGKQRISLDRQRAEVRRSSKQTSNTKFSITR